MVLPTLKSKKKHQRLKDISKQTSSNICSHLENPSCGQAVPGWVGEVGTAAAAAGPIPGRARGGEGLAQVIRRLRPQQLLGPRC
jgi:hypothetical protein